MESRNPQSSLITARPLVLTEKDWKKLNADQRFQARRLYNAGGREMARLYIANITQPKNSKVVGGEENPGNYQKILRPFVSGLRLKVREYAEIARLSVGYASKLLINLEQQGFLYRKGNKRDVNKTYSITRHGLKALGVLKDEF